MRGTLRAGVACSGCTVWSVCPPRVSGDTAPTQTMTDPRDVCNKLTKQKSPVLFPSIRLDNKV